MALDFTFERYREICSAIAKSDYEVMTVLDYALSEQKPHKFIIFRHDVDLKPSRSLMMAEIELEYGILSTYYFRTVPAIYKKELIRKISSMGHEVGYHYETLDKARGDLDKAIELFESELIEFRKVVPVRTACMHGNSKTRWDNKEIWKTINLEDLNLEAEAYLSIDTRQMLYFTDSSRSWHPERYKILDIVESQKITINNSSQIIDIINEGRYRKIYILIHPDEWSDNILSWTTDLVVQKVKNSIKYFVKRYREKHVSN